MAPFSTTSFAIDLDDGSTMEPVLLERPRRAASPELRAAVGIAVSTTIGAAFFLTHERPAPHGETGHRVQRAAIIAPSGPGGEAVRLPPARRVRKPATAKPTRTSRETPSPVRPSSPAPSPRPAPPAVTAVQAPVPARALAKPQAPTPPPAAPATTREFF